MIALIGMSGRFPEAADAEALWQAVLKGRDCIRRFEPEPGRSPSRQGHVPARGWFDGLYEFDAEFFGYAPAEAAMIDPQQRLFLQEAWRALENAGYRPDRVGGRVGVFAGCGINTHLIFDILTGTSPEDDDPMPKVLGNEKDFLASRVSYKLGLQGPSVNVQTACSTSLAAVHLACQSLLSGEADMALAGGASIFTRPVGYDAQPGGILSTDGVCRPFDAAGQGFVPGNGVGVVCLKRLEDALADGDHVRLVIRGSAMNNDGARKAGFTAPSVEGQVEAIREALMMAAAQPGSIGFVETHGTGTSMGDPIEFEALRRGLAGFADPQGCALGALKANIGHLDTAAGVAALIKTMHVIETGAIPPLANLTNPNPLLSLEGSGLSLPREIGEWRRPRPDRWACVHGLGLGGTNVHLVVSGAPEPPSSRPPGKARITPVSARSQAGLERMLSLITDRLNGADEVVRRDVTFTLGHGRYPHHWRRALVTDALGEAVAPASSETRPRQAWAKTHAVMLFPGGGAQHHGMARGLFTAEPVFRTAYLDCAAYLSSAHSVDLAPEQTSWDGLLGPVVGLSALFAVEWALAQLWLFWGMRPNALLGHSAGEYVAAAVAGVFSLHDALDLVVTRARLMETLPAGGMLSVQLSEDRAKGYCGGEIGLAAVNSPTASVLSGPAADLERLALQLERDGVHYRRLDIAVAAHSPAMDALTKPFAVRVASMPRHPPRIDIISSATGSRLTDEQTMDPEYWGEHLRRTVMFKAGVETALSTGANLFLELGPGHGLSSLGREIAIQSGAAADFLPSLPGAGEARAIDDHRHLLGTLARAWERGAELDWKAINGEGRRVPLPATEFLAQDLRLRPTLPRSAAKTRSLWTEVLTPRPLPPNRKTLPSYIVLGEGVTAGLVAARLRQAGADVLYVAPRWAEADAELSAVLDQAHGRFAVVDLTRLDNAEPTTQEEAGALLGLARALAARVGAAECELTVATSGCLDGRGDRPMGAAALGFVHALAAEMPGLYCLGVDMETDMARDPSVAATALVEELTHWEAAPRLTVLRRPYLRRVRAYSPVEHSGEAAPIARTVLVTGGFGGLGLALAGHLADRGARRIALLGRRLPEPGGSVGEALRALTEKGVSLHTLVCDVADAAALAQAVGRVSADFGGLDLVIHAAGHVAGGVAVLKDPAEMEQVLRPKIDGAMALVEALRPVRPGRLVLFSALDAHLGTPGLSDHCAANAFLDAYAEGAGRILGAPVTAIAWSAWSETGQAARVRIPAELASLRAETSYRRLSTAEACSLFDEVMALRLPAVVVCPGDLPTQVSTVAALSRSLSRGSVSDGARRRDPEKPLVAAATETEALLCGVFGDVLGLKDVGAIDDFFELGGHSLLGLSLMSTLQHAFDAKLPLTLLVEHRTPRNLAEAIEAILIATFDLEPFLEGAGHE